MGLSLIYLKHLGGHEEKSHLASIAISSDNSPHSLDRRALNDATVIYKLHLLLIVLELSFYIVIELK